MTRCVYRPSRIVNGKRVRQRMYRLAYQFPGMARKKFVSLNTTDKQVAEKRADDFLRERQQEAAGIILPKVLRDSGHRELTEHIRDYTRDLRSSQRDEGYVYTVEKRLLKLARECSWHFFREITADSFQAWRTRQRKAAKTLKQYFDTAVAFIKWMERHQRCMGNPLERVSRIETRGREKRVRRALSREEIARLLAVSGSRRLGYLAAIYTGLRRGELKALQWGDVHLEEGFLIARAATTKNRRASSIPLHDDLRSALKAERAARFIRHEAVPVFTQETLGSMYRMRQDLKSANIPEEDAQGRRVDFHALRGSLNTHLALAKVDPQTRQQIMRHSDIRLTLGVYTDKTMLPIADALRSLPSFSRPPESEDATLCATILDADGLASASAGTTGRKEPVLQSPENERVGLELPPRDAIWHEGQNGCLTRTRT